MLAWIFRWPPESLMNLGAEDLLFWAERVEDIEKAQKAAKNA